ncbi:putative tail fiber protein (GpH) [Escherichia coli M056]|nr:phage tail protein [Escherichia coli]OSK22888.1 putative tail fiber protein (GpH) [Escherichia coli M056]
MSDYFALLTDVGAARLARAAALGKPLNLTRMAVGDGGGSLPVPDPGQTQLAGEHYRAALNTLQVDPDNDNQIIAEQVIPEDAGGWWIREIGLFDDEDNLIAVANCPETYKPLLKEGSGRVQVVRMILVVNCTDAITLKIDPSVVLATRSYVDSAVAHAITVHEKSVNHPDATLTSRGFTQLCSATDSDSETESATPKAVKAAYDNAEGRLARDQNGADIPDKTRFVENIGLDDAVKKANGAVQRAGDTMTGKLTLPQTSSFGVNCGNGLGGNSITIGEYTTGLKQSATGVLDVYTNGYKVITLHGDLVKACKPLNVEGRVTPSDYGNFDARYQTKSGNMVTGVRLGGVGSYCPPNTSTWTQNYGNGNVLTGMIVQDTGKNSADNIGGVYYRPLQYCINGAWYTAASV